MSGLKVLVKKLRDDVKIPSYAFSGDAGMDLCSCEDYTLRSGERHTFKLGFATEFPKGYVALIWDKSGLAARHGLTVLAGVVDYNYRGEYGVVLLNTNKKPYEVRKGDKIAQLLIQRVEQAEAKEVKELSDTDRGNGGFGSTGK